MPRTARLFAAWSSGIALALGLVGQVVYHVLTALGYQQAPVAVVEEELGPAGVIGDGGRRVDVE